MPQHDPNMPEPGKHRPPPPDDEFGSIGADQLNVQANPAFAGMAQAVLEDVLKQQFRHWTAGMTVLVETYLDQNPVLRAHESALIALLDQEIMLRLDRNQPPSVDELTGRFPQLSDTIRQLLTRRTTERANQAQKETKPPSSKSSVQLNKPPSSRLRGGPSDSAKRRSSSQVSMMVIESAQVAGFEILEEIGRGGMGVVYKAVQTALKRPVALKMILSAMHASEEQIARFRREAEAVAKIHHTNIVAVYDVGEFDGSPYLALEFVDGGSLADMLNGRPMPPLEAAMMVEPLARGVYAAHQQGIIHRDLKPANILLTRQGSPKISDFGLAKHMDESSGWTRTGDIMGTPCYMAPEQAEGRIKLIGPGTDIYALGAILYELMTGQPPFRGTTTLETLEQVRTKDPVPPSKITLGIPWALETICLKCLEKNPKDRYENAKQLADDLLRFLKDEPISARRPSSFTRLAKWYSKNRGLAAALTFFSVVMIGGVAAAAYFLLDKPKDRDLVLGSTPTLPVASTPTTALQPTPPSKPSEPTETRAVETPATKPSVPATPPKATLTEPAKTHVAMDTKPTAPTQPTATMVAINDTPTRPSLPKPEPTKPLSFDQLLAKAQKTQEPLAAIELYHQLLERVRSGEINKEPVDVHELILAPALKLAKGLDPGDDAKLSEKIATLFAAKGRLLRENPYESWRFGRDAMLEAADAYLDAIKYYPKRQDRMLAELYTGHGIVMTRVRQLPQVELLKAVEEDAKNAIAAAADYAGGWNLRGFGLALQAKQELGKLEFNVAVYRHPPRQYPLEHLNQAIEAYDQAVTKAKSSDADEYLPVYYTNRSAALYLLGFCEVDPAARRMKFEQAEADALAATQLARNYDLAWQALGNAREALAVKSLRIALTDRYPLAADAFRQQSELRPGNIDAQFNQARCLAKQALDNVGGPQVRSEALNSLHAILRDEPQHADAHFWLGRLLLADKPDEAHAHFVAALKHPQQGPAMLPPVVNLFATKPAELVLLLKAALPEEADLWTAKHVPLLLLRARAGFELAAAGGEEFTKPKPQPWLDAEEAYRLAEQPTQQAAARFWAAQVRFAQFLRFRTDAQRREQLIAWLKEVDEKLIDMLKLDGNSLGYFDAVTMLTNVKFIFGTDRQSALADRKKALEDAVRLARSAEDRAAPSEKAGWNRTRRQLQEALQKLEQEQP